MDSIHITLAANILKFRKRSGMSQETLAEALGVSNQAVSKWETAKTTPAVALLPQLADIFGCHIDELLGERSSPSGASIFTRNFRGTTTPSRERCCASAERS